MFLDHTAVVNHAKDRDWRQDQASADRSFSGRMGFWRATPTADGRHREAALSDYLRLPDSGNVNVKFSPVTVTTKLPTPSVDKTM